MSNNSVSMRAEDEMLRFAYVEATIKKTYAVRFNGYPDDLPYFFKRHMVNKNARGRYDTILFYGNRECHQGNWIVITPDDKTEIYSEQQFRSMYQSVLDLSY